MTKIKETKRSKKKEDEYIEETWPPPFDKIEMPDGTIASFVYRRKKGEPENEL